MSLWSDDAAIRSLASQHGVPAFGTLALLHVLTEAGRMTDTLREDVLTLARGYVADLVLTEDELTSLAAENHYLPGPATLVIGRPLFWAVPGAAQAQFTELASNVNRHAPESLTAWLQAACSGLIARCPQAPPQGHVIALAEAVATKIHASESMRTRLIDVAIQAANNPTETTQ
jgi:hypothetical protein